jgi:hypothetical protein
MKKLYYNVILYLLGASLIGCTQCHNKEITTSAFVETVLSDYVFTMSDTYGSKILDGNLSLKVYIEPEFSGTYTKTTVYRESFAGLSTMSGSCTGKLNEKDKSGFINMNPKISDNNIMINFRVQGDALTGTWTYSTMTGSRDNGVFTATKIKL